MASPLEVFESVEQYKVNRFLLSEDEKRFIIYSRKAKTNIRKKL